MLAYHSSLPTNRGVSFLLGVIALAICPLFGDLAAAQSTPLPSQRYLPVRQSAYEQAIRQQAQRATQPQRVAVHEDIKRLPSSGTAVLPPAPPIPASSDYYPEEERQMVRTTSYQEPAVPTILSKSQKSTVNIPSTMPESRALNPLSESTASSSKPNNTKKSFAPPAVSQIEAGRGLRPQDYTGNLSLRNSELPTTKATHAPLKSDSSFQPGAPTRLPLMPQAKPIVPVNAAPAPASSAEANGLRSRTLETASQRIEQENRMASQAGGTVEVPDATPTVSATQFVADINRRTGQEQQRPTAQTPRLVAKQGAAPVSPAMKLATGNTNADSLFEDNRVQPVNAVENSHDTELKLAAPAIDVVAVGPETIGINKPSIYKIIVRNNSTIKAERILVGVNMPSWVDIENVSLTSGGKEITDGQNRARLVWNVDQVEGNSSQTLTVTAVPRKAEMFDVGVEWTLVPRNGKTSIRVTEPKLEMSITGPQTVLYGETALYHVAVRNPGTGAAEDVSIMLPEALGGERQPLGIIPPGKEKNLQIELVARTAGDLLLNATATAEGNLKTQAERSLKVLRANLQITMMGPPLKYAGGVGEYTIKIQNTGDATATDVLGAVALPTGVKYLKGIEAVKLMDGGMKWSIGSLEPEQTKTYRMFCQLDTSGDLQLEVGVQGKGDLAAAGACLTTVETVADLVLTVADPKGPLPTGENVPYTIKIRNRGTRAAKSVDLVMLFSDGIEPREAKGLNHEIKPGQVLFSPIGEIAPNQEISVEVIAEAIKGGTHVFRAQLKCEQSDTREVAEGTTRFFGDSLPQSRVAEADDNSFSK